MAPAATPTILSFNYALDFLDYILQNHAPPTTLIVCSTREHFLQQLLVLVLPSEDQGPPPADEGLEDATPTQPQLHHFLTPTIQLIATSRTIKLAFCPSLEHLRAYLAAFRAPTYSPDQCGRRPGPRRPLLAILDFVALHHGTADFAAQGLSRTFASAAEAAARENMSLVICECEDVLDEQNRDRGRRLWDLHIPLLNGTVRFGGEDRPWAGRTVTAKRVAQRWFVFRENEENESDVIDIE